MKKITDDILFTAKNFDTFLNSIIHHWLKTLTFIGITLIPIFGILDYFIMPSELVTRIWIYRLVNTLILIIQYFILRVTKPARYSFLHGYFASLVTTLTIIQMTSDLGGFNSSYYQGLNLVIIAVNLLIPWRPVHSAANGLLTVILYVIVNLITFHVFDMQILINNLFFLTATVIISVSINYLRHNLVKKEFLLRGELKAARDALWGEMEIAKKIQTALLPAHPKLTNFEVYASMRPADEVGGDYYDIIETSFGETWLAIGDVSGHGVESGLIMMMTHTCIYSLVNQNKGLTPAEIIDRVNYVIKENIQRLDVNRYVTLNVLKLDAGYFSHSGKHQDILIYRAASKTVEIFPTNGTWIGVTNDLARYLKNDRVDLKTGDVILLYTDGIVEAENQEQKMYTFERLTEIFLENAALPVKSIVNNLMDDVLKFQAIQRDDITLLACRKV
ncbi:MAG: serine/threonine-protein phosphatase [Spirochaetia bacterium]|nr:serine/threonine-protein phosphatase [Spirochaetia bacterium]